MGGQNSGDDEAASVGEALYVRFERILHRSIQRGSLPVGTVLLEGKLAELLGSSRAPVRQALAKLEESRLVRRFDGRGYLVGNSEEPVRSAKLSSDMLEIDEPPEALRRSFAWEAIYEEIERTVIHRSAFGRFRVNELELARHYKVGRTVARDVLTRLQSLGILDKDERQRWTTVALDRTRLLNLYEVRELIEPAALKQAIEHINMDHVMAMRHTLVDTLELYPNISSTMMNDLEYDLHVRCLETCSNKELLDALSRTRCVLTLSKHVLGVEMDIPEHDPFMEEHLHVFDLLIAGKPTSAAEALRRHLRSSCPKVVERLETFREIYVPPHVDYIY